MPRRNDEYEESRKDLIVAAAVRAALRKGLVHSTMHDIANEARISMGAIPFLGSKPAIATRSGIDDLPSATTDSTPRHQLI